MKLHSVEPGGDAARLLSSRAQRDAIRRAVQGKAVRTAPPPSTVDELVEAVTERVIRALRPEVRRLEQRLTRLVADVALHDGRTFDG